MKNIPIALTTDELYQCLVVGGHRRITSMFHRKTAQHYISPDNSEWSTEIESCCAELAFSKATNKYWSGGVFSGERALHDSNGKQVRHTHYANGKLIIYEEDNPDDKFILVTGRAPNYVLVGWIFGRTAQECGKDHQWWTSLPKKQMPSWWVPQDELSPFPDNLLKLGGC